MNIIKIVLNKINNKYKQRKFKSACKVIKQAGFSVVNIQTRGNASYLVDAAGSFYKIGRVK